MTPKRLAQLVAFLQELGLDPAAPGGPGATADALAPIDEALTHSSLGKPYNHERLEFLGDAVLRLAATEFLRRDYGALRVGEQSALRGELVSDRWLADLAQICGLTPMVRLGPKASGDTAGQATIAAECAEALLGAIFLTWGGSSGGLEPLIHWLAPHWRRSAEAVLADPHRRNWKSALQEWTQSQGLGLPSYNCVEQSLAHGDPQRFNCTVIVSGSSTFPMDRLVGQGCGKSRREAEQASARQLLALARVRATSPGEQSYNKDG